MPPKKTVKEIKTVANSGPSNNPMSGVFDAMLGQTAAPSLPGEMANSNSYNLISLQYVMLSYAYVLHGPIRTLVDQPVYDAFRGGLTITTDEVSPEELEAFHKELKKLKLTKKIIEALRWDRLFGGAGIIVNTNQDYTKPFKVDSINENSKLEFIVADRWQLPWTGIPGSPNSAFNYSPGGYYDPAQNGLVGKKIHQSRVAKVIGEMPPNIVRQRLQGWGMSSVECVIRELNQYFKENNVIFELLDEAKVDIWKIKGFNAAVLADLAKGKTSKRIQTATYMKNFLNAITLDKEDDYEQKQVTFSGLSEILEQIRIGMAAAIRMPMAKIFGLASKGFASGEDDIENYNAIVEGQRDRAEEVLDLIVPICAMKTWGMVPEDLGYKWKPLRVLSAEQEQNVLNAKHTRNKDMYSLGMLTPQEFMAAQKQDGVFTMETEVSKGVREPEPPMIGLMEEGGEGDDKSAKKPSDGKTPTKEKD